MLKTPGLDWRISLAQECWFYFRTCRNWRKVIQARLYGAPLARFEMRGSVVVGFPESPPWQIFQEIWRNQVYTRRYPREWGNPRTIVDIGANIGVFSLYAARRWHQARILAFEPAPDNFHWLEKNAQLSSAWQITCRPVAVAGKSGQADFYLKEESGWHSLIGDGAKSSITVQTTTLDAVLDETGATAIDLLKLDCEGAEYNVLSGRESLLARTVRFVAMEYHEVSGHTVDELTKLFASVGFHTESIPEPRWRTGMLYATNRSTF